MTKQSIRESLDRTGFTFADVGDVRITARGPRVPGGKIGRKTAVTVRRGAETVESRKCCSNGRAASVFLDYVERYR